MVFSSSVFLFVFLPLCLLFYYLCPTRRGKNFILFTFSLVFYAWGEPVFVLLMLLSIAVNFGAGLLIEHFQLANNRQAERFTLWASVVFNLGLIGVFKYSAFAVGSVNSLLHLSLPLPQIALPIGISFYTFQIMTYVIDVYRRDERAQHSFVALGTYISMFPQLIAGPIVRYGDIADQLENRKETFSDFAEGSRIFILGLCKKVLIANPMGAIADHIINAGTANTFTAWIGILAYTFQIFFDFSGYSTMAIGLGRMFGFHMPENFRYPYTATSITDFWRRWHITLSTFFRDYVYIPLGGNRVKKSRWFFNLFIVWFCTGLWHGASWNFVLWGLYYAVLLVIEKQFLGKWMEKWPKFLRILYSFFLVVLGWVLFRMESFSAIGSYFSALFGFGSGVDTALSLGVFDKLPYFLPAVLFSFPIFQKLYDRMQKNTVGIMVMDLVLFGLLLLCVTALTADTFNPFIYFRF